MSEMNEEQGIKVRGHRVSGATQSSMKQTGICIYTNYYTVYMHTAVGQGLI